MKYFCLIFLALSLFLTLPNGVQARSHQNIDYHKKADKHHEVKKHSNRHETKKHEVEKRHSKHEVDKHHKRDIEKRSHHKSHEKISKHEKRERDRDKLHSKRDRKHRDRYTSKRDRHDRDDEYYSSKRDRKHRDRYTSKRDRRDRDDEYYTSKRDRRHRDRDEYYSSRRGHRKHYSERRSRRSDYDQEVAWLEHAQEGQLKMTGKASWYGTDFHGGPTASGIKYDMYTFTAAHRTLPMGTVVKVTTQDSGKSVMVCVTDRGPYVRGRIIDLSYAAATQLDLRHKGVGDVKLEVVSDSKGTPLKARQAFYVEYKAARGHKKAGPYKDFSNASAMHEALREAHPEAKIILADK